MHVFDPDYPLSVNRKLPTVGTADQYLDYQARLGTQRTVIVAAAVYGTDNRCLLAALKHLGPQARGVITFPTDVDDKTLSCLHEAGVRGIRYNPYPPTRMAHRNYVQL
jgi:predicted TIM-barrel fold metal-dependent hydrolase